MQNLSPNSNPSGQYPHPWLVTYIQKTRVNQSRYEIDLYLLQRGYDANEIAEAWNRLSQPAPEARPWFTQLNYLNWLVRIGTVLIVIVLGVLILTGKEQNVIAPPLPPTISATLAPSRVPFTTAPIPVNINSDFIENIKMDGTSGKKGGEFVYTFAGQSPSQLNPYYSTGTVESGIIRQIYSSLIGQSPNSKYYAYLLTEVPTLENGDVKISADGKSMDVTLKMKQGLKWSDGSALTLRDLDLTWQWVTDPDNSNLTIDTTPWNLISGIDSPSPGVAVLHFKQVYGPYLNFLNNFYPLPEKVRNQLLSKNNPSQISEAVVPAATSGPFKVDYFSPTDRIVLLRNDNFSPVWGFNAYLDKVIFRNTSDAATALTTLTLGNLDVVENLDDNQLSAASAISTGKTDSISQYSWEYLQYNLSNPLFQDKNVRLALLKAIDRSALTKQFRTPKTLVMAVNLPEFSIFANPTLKPYLYDPQNAKKLLDDAGWKTGPDGIRLKDGKRFSFTLSSTTSPIRKATAEAIIAYWKLLGLEVNYQPYNSVNFFGGWRSDGILVKGKYDVAMVAFAGEVDPDSSYGNYASSQIPSEANQGNGHNFGHINDPKIDQIFEAERSTTDLKRRKELFQQLQSILYENVYEAPLFGRLNNYIVSNKVHNFKPNPTSDTNWWNAVELYVN